jgi:hypothetical protein
MKYIAVFMILFLNGCDHKDTRGGIVQMINDPVHSGASDK